MINLLAAGWSGQVTFPTEYYGPHKLALMTRALDAAWQEVEARDKASSSALRRVLALKIMAAVKEGEGDLGSLTRLVLQAVRNSTRLRTHKCSINCGVSEFATVVDDVRYYGKWGSVRTSSYRPSLTLTERSRLNGLPLLSGLTRLQVQRPGVGLEVNRQPAGKANLDRRGDREARPGSAARQASRPRCVRRGEPEYFQTARASADRCLRSATSLLRLGEC